MNKTLSWITAILVITAVSWGCSKKDGKRTISIKGSTTILPIAMKSAEEYMKGNDAVSFSISGTGSVGPNPGRRIERRGPAAGLARGHLAGLPGR